MSCETSENPVCSARNSRQTSLPQMLAWALIFGGACLFNSSVMAQKSAVDRTAASKLTTASLKSPVTAFVVSADADVRSGPSEDSYPTCQIARGAALEVFHRTKDGWLGVRPPEGSFSWIMARDAFLLPGGKSIEITGEKAVSWIGSNLGDVSKFRWQLQLQRGEQLAVLGEIESKNAAGEKVLWYKVAPPSGEFRWVHEGLVSMKPPVEPGVARVLPSRSGQNTPEVTGASAIDDERMDVQTAGYRQEIDAWGDPTSESELSVDGYSADQGEFVINGRTIRDGDVIYLDDSQMIADGAMEYSNGELVDGAYVDGESYVESNATSMPTSLWDGWHAMELTDEGFRIPFLERRYQQAQSQQMHDPRNHDPFSLAMVNSVPVPSQSVRQHVRQEVGITPDHGYTPWRDPRELREQRMQGYPTRAPSDYYSPTNTGDELSYDTGEQNRDASTAGRLLARLTSTFAKGEEPITAASDSQGMAESSANSTVITPQDVQQSLTASGWNGLASTAERAPIATSYPSLPIANEPVGVSEVDLLQLSLSEMVAGPMERWDFTQLSMTSQRLVEVGATPVERGKARLVLDRMREFEAVARKSGIDPNRGGVMPAGGIQGGAVVTAEHKYEPEIQASHYDATGYLVPVHASTAGQPTHALTRKDGSIVAYVTSLPGMNLDLYINQSVGIKGLRGYLPQLQANHIQAQRIVRIVN